jgi:hypothetical protein
VHYYESLFTSSNTGDMAECLCAVNRKVSPTMNEDLLKDFTMA